jgi:hypothetical protein
MSHTYLLLELIYYTTDRLLFTASTKEREVCVWLGGCVDAILPYDYTHTTTPIQLLPYKYNHTTTTPIQQLQPYNYSYATMLTCIHLSILTSNHTPILLSCLASRRKRKRVGTGRRRRFQRARLLQMQTMPNFLGIMMIDDGSLFM